MPERGPSGAVPGGVITSQSPPFAVPIRYMCLGVICFALFAVDFLVQSTALAQGIPGAPHIVALTHALTLGALLSFVMGAVYQLTTVAFLIPISSVPAARWNFWLYLLAFVGLFVSMSAWWSVGLLVFGSLMALAVYIYAVVLVISLLRTKNRDAMFGFVVSAHVYLMLAVAAAVLLVLVDAGRAPGLSAILEPLLATHITLAVGGFFSFLVMGFSFKLLPMFTLSHGFPTWRQRWTLALAHVALWCILGAIWSPVRPLFWVGAAVGLAAFVNHGLDVRGIVRKRMRKKVESPIRGVIAALVAALVGLCLLVLRLLWGRGAAGWQDVVAFYLLGVVTLTVMSFAYKIVPFLVWSKRYSKPSGKGKPILISDLLRPDRARPVLIGFAAGLVVLTASRAALWTPGVVVGCAAISAAAAVFCVQVMRVMEPGKLGRELFERD
ncbi:MAG: hypothetical protein K6T78_10245 [Alicyclobacillus sp.]|nr:hypothetical protein [Alicyclobacillus sp.]